MRKLLDTSTLSEVIKGKDADLLRRAGEYLTEHGHLTFSILTRYEILRGLHAKSASRQIASFERQCAGSEILPLSDEIVVEAAKIYALLRNKGQLIGDADILIAATARVHGLAVVSENFEHFERIPALPLESWRSGLLRNPQVTS